MVQKLILISFIFLFSKTAYCQKTVVLVPGFFNSFAPEYFSVDIEEALQKKGFKTHVVEGLDPVGTIEENGERLIPQLKKIIQQDGGEAPYIIAHSAGGFYSLYAIFHAKIPITKMITVSTPYLGLDFIQAWRDHSNLFENLTNLACLDGLKQLTPQYARTFLDNIQVPDNLKIYTFGGWQPRRLDIWDARNLSAILRVPDHYIPGDSDGIVSFKSSLGILNIKTFSKKPAQIFVDSKFIIPLEHWEQVLDYKNFIILGTRNIKYVQETQKHFYSGLADLLLTSN
jgi:pimeloyl-ACP methyl ester carboxylesterase